VRPRTTSRPSPPPELLPVSRVSDLDDTSAEQRWLVESLWAKAGVGIVGGAPKSCKSWLGLDLALSVATATPCLGQYAVRDAGPVLLYLAEDAPGAVKQRLLSLARARGVTLDAGISCSARLRRAGESSSRSTQSTPRSSSVLPVPLWSRYRASS
jgi:hypothetical protein